MFRFGFEYLKLKRKASRAGRIFEQELLDNGIDKKTAKRLKEEYLKGSHFFRHFEGHRGS